ncbi:hypothetical protein ACFVGN_36135 [Streptomyces sp. NPDC057757]|uniref:hypothetical protein n=1 Tax=Streptomyces sp. NPDC057757 TaxID=3346241 RepID=UPI0036A5C320
MTSLARWCHRHRVLTVFVWLALLVGLGLASTIAKTSYDDSMTMPSSESVKAIETLRSAMPAAAGDQDTVVWHVSYGTVDDQGVKERITEVLGKITDAPGVASVAGPYTDVACVAEGNAEIGGTVSEVSLSWVSPTDTWKASKAGWPSCEWRRG